MIETALPGDDVIERGVEVAVAQPIAGGPPSRVLSDVTVDSTMLPSGLPVTSSDGKTLYVDQRAQRVTADASRPPTMLSYRLADKSFREVVAFDEPARPHSTASSGIVEYNGWLYFTLSDFQSDIWVATVTGFIR